MMNIWSQARALAIATPPDRNRYADLLRALSILFVILGHWLMTTAVYDKASQTLTPVLALDVVDWSAWLTWGFQVMPIFFIVGGYSNAISLASARRRNLSYAQWLTGRLQRLLTPLTVLVVFWAIVAFVLNLAGIPEAQIRFFSQSALVPTWFLAIYTMIVLLAPLSHRFWQRWGYGSLLIYVGAAVFVDAAFFALEWTWLGWSNYFWVWLAMHHLGFAWHDGRLGSPRKLLAIALCALLALSALIFFGPYPIAMAGSPGDEVSNTLPPKVTLIALGVFQFGLLMALEKPVQRLLQRVSLWTATVLVNSMIMTVYLWHMTVLVGLMALCYLADGLGFGATVGSLEWWSTRPLWLAALTVLLIPVALLLSRLEHLTFSGKDRPPGAVRLVLGAVFAGLGIALASLLGLNGNIWEAANTGIVALMLVGAYACGVSLRRLTPSSEGATS